MAGGRDSAGTDGAAVQGLRDRGEDSAFTPSEVGARKSGERLQRPLPESQGLVGWRRLQGLLLLLSSVEACPHALASSHLLSWVVFG